MKTQTEVNTNALRIWLAERPERLKARQELCSMAGISMSLLVQALQGRAPRIPELRYKISKATGIRERILFPTFEPLDAS